MPHLNHSVDSKDDPPHRILPPIAESVRFTCELGVLEWLKGLPAIGCNLEKLRLSRLSDEGSFINGRTDQFPLSVEKVRRITVGKQSKLDLYTESL